MHVCISIKSLLFVQKRTTEFNAFHIEKAPLILKFSINMMSSQLLQPMDKHSVVYGLSSAALFLLSDQQPVNNLVDRIQTAVLYKREIK